MPERKPYETPQIKEKGEVDIDVQGVICFVMRKFEDGHRVYCVESLPHEKEHDGDSVQAGEWGPLSETFGEAEEVIDPSIRARHAFDRCLAEELKLSSADREEVLGEGGLDVVGSFLYAFKRDGRGGGPISEVNTLGHIIILEDTSEEGLLPVGPITQTGVAGEDEVYQAAYLSRGDLLARNLRNTYDTADIMDDDRFHDVLLDTNIQF